MQKNCPLIFWNVFIYSTLDVWCRNMPIGTLTKKILYNIRKFCYKLVYFLLIIETRGYNRINWIAEEKKIRFYFLSKLILKSGEGWRPPSKMSEPVFLARTLKRFWGVFKKCKYSDHSNKDIFVSSYRKVFYHPISGAVFKWQTRLDHFLPNKNVLMTFFIYKMV
jgi:hypothetical protein